MRWVPSWVPTLIDGESLLGELILRRMLTPCLMVPRTAPLPPSPTELTTPVHTASCPAASTCSLSPGTSCQPAAGARELNPSDGRELEDKYP